MTQSACGATRTDPASERRVWRPTSRFEAGAPRLGAMTTAVPAPPATATVRRWFIVNAVVAWLGLTVQLVVTALGLYPNTDGDRHLFGPGNMLGAAGALGRVLDFLSYFTIWSNIVVAVTVTMLALQPRRDDQLMRVLRLSALLMITVTGLIYAIVLAPTNNPQGWAFVADRLLHMVTPLLTVIVFVAVGPRRWFSLRIVELSLIVPTIWLSFALARGAVIDAWPYPFMIAATLGYPRVLANIVGVLVVALVVATLLWGIDRLLSRRTAA